MRRVLESKARHLHEYMYRITIAGGGRLPMLLADEHELYKAIGKIKVSLFMGTGNKRFEQRTSNSNGASGNHIYEIFFYTLFREP